jgi:uncharacterized protein YacL
LEKARRYFAVVGAVLGGIVAFYMLGPINALFKTELGIYESIGIIIFSSAIISLIMFFGGPPTAVFIGRSVEWLESRVVRMPLQDIAVGAGGLIIGLIIANLLAPSLKAIPFVGGFLPSIIMVIMAYIGIAVARSKKDDIFNIASIRTRIKNVRTQKERRGISSGVPVAKLLDTSTIIDGRIADICNTGFIEGPIIVPSFVLDELRRIADSTDNMKRSKGRRGLDILNDMQKNAPVEISIQDWNDDADQDVDFRLIKMAKKMGARIITTDFNLAKIAEFQDVGVLNINRLANSLKPIVSAGEDLTISIIKEGKEPGQGVGYLEDGTMVVVEQAKKHIGDIMQVTVTNCHTTPAGRMIFARPKYLDKAVQEGD